MKRRRLTTPTAALSALERSTTVRRAPVAKATGLRAD
jgi:hypothetical protein